MKIFRLSIYVIIFTIGGIILWHFGHHHPEEEIIKNQPNSLSDANPRIILNDSPSTSSSSIGSTTDAPQEPVRENSDKNKRNMVLNDGTSSIELGQEIPIPDEVAAFEAFLTAEKKYEIEKEVFKKALISGDDDRIEVATNSIRNARLKRNEELRNLADSSDEASKLLAEIEVREAEVVNETARIVAEIESEVVKPTKPRPKPELPFDKEELRMLFNALPLKDQRFLLDKFPSLKHLLQAD